MLYNYRGDFNLGFAGGEKLKQASSNAELKRAVGISAADLVGDGMVVGIGTGSTVAFLIEELGKRVKDGLKIKGVPTSYQAKLLCYQQNIPIIEPGMLDRLDLAIDGADEIDGDLNAIKGGGAAHTNEKIIASMADEFILIADNSKLVKELGTTFPIPVEVIPNALGLVTKKARELGAEPLIRMAVRKDGPVVTDQGNFVIDLMFSSPPDIFQVDSILHNTPGVVETGLFIGIAKKALIAKEGKVLTLLPGSFTDY